MLPVDVLELLERCRGKTQVLDGVPWPISNAWERLTGLRKNAVLLNSCVCVLPHVLEREPFAKMPQKDNEG